MPLYILHYATIDVEGLQLQNYACLKDLFIERELSISYSARISQ